MIDDKQHVKVRHSATFCLPAARSLSLARLSRFSASLAPAHLHGSTCSACKRHETFVLWSLLTSIPFAHFSFRRRINTFVNNKKRKTQSNPTAVRVPGAFPWLRSINSWFIANKRPNRLMMTIYIYFVLCLGTNYQMSIIVKRFQGTYTHSTRSPMHKRKKNRNAVPNKQTI